jgi:hypothetical protein
MTAPTPPLDPPDEDHLAEHPPRTGPLTADLARLRASNRLLVALLARLFEVLGERDTPARKAEVEKLRGKFEAARQRIQQMGDG